VNQNTEMSKPISFVINSLLKKSDNISIEYKYDDYSAIHYLLVFPATFFDKEKFQEEIYELSQKFEYRYSGEEICILPFDDNRIDLLGALETIETFKTKEKITLSSRLQKNVFSPIEAVFNQIFAPQYRFALGATMMAVILIGVYSLLPNVTIGNNNNITEISGDSKVVAKNLLVLQKALKTAKITVETQQKTLIDKENIVTKQQEELAKKSQALADAESVIASDGTLATAFDDMVKSTDLKENLQFSNKNEKLIIQNLRVNQLITSFSVIQNNQTLKGQFNFKYELVTIQNIGTGRFYKNPNGKITLQLLQENGTVHTWTAL
jgi:hypothetical protein